MTITINTHLINPTFSENNQSLKLPIIDTSQYYIGPGGEALKEGHPLSSEEQKKLNEQKKDVLFSGWYA